MAECKPCSRTFQKEVEEKYKIKIYSIKYVSLECGTSVWSKLNEKIPFKKWSVRTLKGVSRTRSHDE